MPNASESVRIIETALALGFTPSDAILRALDTTTGELAGELGQKGSAVSMCLNYYKQQTYGPIRDGVAQRLGVPREYIDGVIERRQKEAAPAA